MLNRESKSQSVKSASARSVLIVALLAYSLVSAAAPPGRSRDGGSTFEESPTLQVPDGLDAGGLVQGGGTIRGTVTLAASGFPVSGVRVFASFLGLPGAAGANTAGDGTYQIAVPFDGDYVVYLRDFNSGANVIGQLYSMIECIDPGEVCDVTTGDPVMVPPGGTVENVDFVVDVGGSVRGAYDEVTTGFNAGAFPEVSLFDGGGTLIARPHTSLFNSAGIRTYKTEPAPVGTYFLVASSQGFEDQLYSLIGCPGLACDVTAGTAVTLMEDVVNLDVDFLVEVDGAQGGAFAGTVQPAGVDSTFTPTIRAWDPAQTFLGQALGGPGSYVIAGLPEPEVRATADEFGYAGELWDDIVCDEGFPPCDVSQGDPIPITAGSITGGIDFTLEVPEIFADGFESGDTSAW